MNLPRVASLALLLLAGSAFQSVQAGASNTSGNPFGNGSYFPNEGTFQAVFRGVNLTGVTTFSTVASGSIQALTVQTGSNSFQTSYLAPGSFTITREGTVYSGNISAAFQSTTQVGAVMAASTLRQGGGTINNTLDAPLTTTSTSTFATTGSNAFASETSQSGANPPGTNTSTFNSTSAGSNDTLVSGTSSIGNSIGTATYSDVLQASGSFTANLSPSYPNQSLKGNGSFEFSQLDFSTVVPTLKKETVNFSVSGVRTSNTISSFSAQSASQAYINTTYSTQ